jgi:hypothetical protein
MIEFSAELPKMDGKEVSPGVIIIGEPTRIPGTNKMVALAEFYGTIAKIELVIKIKE